MLWVISLRPGFIFNILAGVVYNAISQTEKCRIGNSDLGVFATLKERSDANESNIVVPHHSVILVVSRDFEYVLKD